MRRKKSHLLQEIPIVVLMPHSACNCRCVMCDIWKANSEKREISPSQLAKHTESLEKLHVRWVVLSGGEPLMHSNLWSLCKILKSLDIRITLLSTGLLLKRHAAEVVRWCDEVIVSLDGSQKIHDDVRRIPDAFNRLSEGVRALRALQPRLRVTGRCVIQRRNYFDLPNIIKAAHDIGLDQISFLAVDVSSSAFNRPTPWAEPRKTEVCLSRNEVERFETVLRETIARHANDFASGFIAESVEKLRRLMQYFRACNGMSDFPENQCNAPWVSTVIEADGTVRPCFFHRTLGNIHDDSLPAILNSGEAIAFRKQLDVKSDPICRKCVCTLNLNKTSLASQISSGRPEGKSSVF